MALDFSVQSLQFRRRNKSGNMSLRYVWDVVSRTDSPARMLIETWGGKPDGYIKAFKTDLQLGKYLSGRVAKGAAGADDTEIELNMIGDEDYVVVGPLVNLGRALEANNHEKAKLRLKITGVDDSWDSDACLNKAVSGIVDYDEESMTCNELNQAMASRVKSTFKRGGNYAENILAINEFMISGEDDMSDVLGGEPVVYKPMDRERIAEVIQLADGLRENMKISPPEVKTPSPDIHIPEPEIIRGTEWGGWA